MRTRQLLAFVLLLPWSAGGAQAPACQPGESTRRIQAELKRLVDSLATVNPAVPGVSLAVIAPRQCLLWGYAAGVASRSDNAPLSPRHTYRIASNTKTYVAAAALRLVEEGRLALNDKLTQHVDRAHVEALRRDGYAVDDITVRHLLTHTAGLYDYAMDERFVTIALAQPKHRWTRREQLDSAVVWGNAYNKPGEGFHYTDTGYILLGEIVERVTGLGLADAMRTLLNFRGLGLNDTWLETLEPVPSGAGPMAAQYMGTTDMRSVDASVDLYGGGGLVATPLDMARFTHALFTGGVYRQPSTLQLMTSTIGSPGPRVYAAGVSQIQAAGLNGWGHSGFWNTWSYHFASHNVTVAAAVTQQGDRVVSRALLERAIQVLVR